MRKNKLFERKKFMEFALPTYGEWLVQMKKEVVSMCVDIPVQDAEKMDDLYFAVNNVLMQCLELPYNYDAHYGPVRATECVIAVRRMSEERQIAALAWIDALINSYDKRTQLMGKNIYSMLMKSYVTGQIPESLYEKIRNSVE